jgi:hypothetical protein
MTGRLEAIWVKRAHRGPMDAVSRATLRAGQGIVGSADQDGRRQVTLIECRMWDAAVEQVGVAIEPSARRALGPPHPEQTQPHLATARMQALTYSSEAGTKSG